MVQERVFQGPGALPFVFSLSEEAKDFLLREGTDLKYGARHLKRAVERHLVHAMSNLIASSQVRCGDSLRVDFDAAAHQLTFFKDAENLPFFLMAEIAGTAIPAPVAAVAAKAPVEPQRAGNSVRKSNQR